MSRSLRKMRVHFQTKVKRVKVAVLVSEKSFKIEMSRIKHSVFLRECSIRIGLSAYLSVCKWNCDTSSPKVVGHCTPYSNLVLMYTVVFLKYSTKGDEKHFEIGTTGKRHSYYLHLFVYFNSCAVSFVPWVSAVFFFFFFKYLRDWDN